MKTLYRISLMENSEGLADTLANLAAKSNGRDKKHSLQDLQHVAKGQQLLYPSLYGGMTCELIGDNILHLDRKVGENYETVLIIEQVEIMEVPTLSSYENTSLLDEQNHELLN